jgi:aryl-alcohol dehydrogenase-like predicted oxidoreductase
MTPGPNGRGLSRKHILSAIDASLTRLGVDYVDLYQIHRPGAAGPESPFRRGSLVGGDPLLPSESVRRVRTTIREDRRMDGRRTVARRAR